MIRLAGQGSPGVGGGPAGDLYLEVNFNPHARFRVNGRDVHLDGIGAANAKLISSACDGKWARIESLTVKELVEIDGIGEMITAAFVRYFADNAVRKSLDLLMRFLDIEYQYVYLSSRYANRAE